METKKGGTLVEVLVVVAILGVFAALLFPVVQVIREDAQRKTEQTLSIKDINDKSVFVDKSVWKVSEEDKHGQRPIILTNESTGREVVVMFKEPPKEPQIFLEGELWPYRPPLTDIYPITLGTPTEIKAEAEKE